MALKGDRHELETDIRHFMNEEAAPGGVVTQSTAASGAAMDNSIQLVTYAAANSGAVPVGILLTSVVNKDLTQTHLNYQKDEVQQGNKVTLLKKGWMTTDLVRADVDPVGGDGCYVGPSGLLTSVQDEGAFQIGDFDTARDEDGYAAINVNIPGPRPTLA